MGVAVRGDADRSAVLKTVAIVGFAPSYVDAPFTDSTITIWTMNYHYAQVPRTDCIFELHDWAVVLKEGQLEYLSQATVPVYLQAARPEVPMSRTYPIDLMREKYTLPDTDLPYFTNSASYMIALAIEEGYEEIRLYGLDMAHDTEYGSQRPSCEFFLGVAHGKGIRVVIHRQSDLLKTAFLYGYEDQKRDWFREKLLTRRKHLADMHGIHMQQFDQHKQALNEFSGALQDIDHIIKVWS